MPDDPPAEPAGEIAEPASETPEKKRRPPFVAIFTFLACCFGVLQFFHEIVEQYDASIEAVEKALERVDIFGLAGGYVDGLRLHGPAMGAGWAYPWESLFAGVAGMWAAMVAGGWLATVAGIIVIATGLGLTIWALSKTDETSNPNPFATAILVVLGVIVAVAIGCGANSLIAQLWGDAGAGAWIAANMNALGAGLGYDVPPPPPGDPLLNPLLSPLLAPPPAPPPGDYHDAGGFLASFAWTHGLFSLETLVIGIACIALIALAAKAIGGIAATILIPFGVLAVVVVGASLAYVLDHLLVVPAIGLILKVATVSALPVGLGAVAFVLEKGHLALSFLESGKKIIGKE